MLEAAAQAYVFFLAGFETSSTTATYCLYELAQYQDIQNKVCKEIDETLKKYGELTYNAVNEMTYLHKIINGNYGIQLPFVERHNFHESVISRKNLYYKNIQTFIHTFIN